MLDICLLGTGGTMPLPGRALTALMAKYNGESILIDCGEGTQVAIKQKGWSMKPVGYIFFTHFHADHIAGLPGFLLTLAKQGRTEPVELIGPKGLEECVCGLCVIAPGLPYEIRLREINEPEESFNIHGLQITAFQADHNISCYNYSLRVHRAGKFQPERAITLGIEKRYWSILQKGESITCGEKVFTPEQVLGAPRRGIHAVYATDTRPTQQLIQQARDADLLICEGMYGDEEKREKALENKHMMIQEAAEVARAAQVHELWLTHYSPSMPRPKEYVEAARRIFPQTVAPEDGLSVDLLFKD